MKGYICDICEKFVDDPFRVHMREFMMTIDWGDGTANPSKIRNKVHMCGDCYTKFVNYIKYKSLKEKVDEQTERAMPKETVEEEINILKEENEKLRKKIDILEEHRCESCPGCDVITHYDDRACDGCYMASSDDGIICECDHDCPKIRKGE